MGLKYDAWKNIGASDAVLDWIVNGIKIEFLKTPSPFKLNNKQFSNEENSFVKEEIKRLLDAGYIKHCENDSFISGLSCAPKKTGGYRLIINLRHLNSFCESYSHKIEDIRNVEKIIKPKDYFTSIDLKDSFYQFPVHKDFQHFLSFTFEGQSYSYCVLPFGFSLSPYYHTKILRPVVTYLRSLGIRLNLYVDDFLVAAALARFRDHTDLVIDTLLDLGLRVNFEKSELEGARSIEYLGYYLDSSGTFPVIKISHKRVIRLKRQIRSVLKKGLVPVRTLAKSAGLCISTAFAVSPGKLFLRHTYRLIASRTSWNDFIVLNKKCIEELQWWLNSVDSFNFKEVKPVQIDFQIEVDASKKCWGAVLHELEAKGDWNVQVSQASSNYRELLAILLALETFKSHIQNLTVEVLSDNSTAGAYVRNKGGPSPELTEIAKAIWGLAIDFNITLICTHIPGIKNIRADKLSRSPDTHNWMLHPAIFNLINKRFGPLTIDRFATSLNAQLPRFNSRYWEPETEAINALAQDWSQENNYVNPPWALIPRILEKVISDRATCTIITPIFRAQPWYQVLEELKVCEPLVLPNHWRLMSYVGPKAEPSKNRSWKLAAWKISGLIA